MEAVSSKDIRASLTGQELTDALRKRFGCLLGYRVSWKNTPEMGVLTGGELGEGLGRET